MGDGVVEREEVGGGLRFKIRDSRFKNGEFERVAAAGGDLAGQADHGETVAAVGGDFDFEAGVAAGPPEGLAGVDGKAGEGEGVLDLVGGQAAGGEVAIEEGDGGFHGRARIGVDWRMCGSAGVGMMK